MASQNVTTLWRFSLNQSGSLFPIVCISTISVICLTMLLVRVSSESSDINSMCSQGKVFEKFGFNQTLTFPSDVKPIIYGSILMWPYILTISEKPAKDYRRAQRDSAVVINGIQLSLYGMASVLTLINYLDEHMVLGRYMPAQQTLTMLGCLVKYLSSQMLISYLILSVGSSTMYYSANCPVSMFLQFLQQLLWASSCQMFSSQGVETRYSCNDRELPIIIFQQMDINNQINLDPHLQLMMIDAQEKKASHSTTLSVKQTQLLMKTRLFTELIKNIEKMQPEAKQAMDKIKRAQKQSLEEIQSLGGEQTIDDLYDLNDDIKGEEYTSRVEELLAKSFKIARIYYEQGDYKDARSLLGQLDYFVQKDPYWLAIGWGKLNTQILMGKTQSLVDSVKKLKARIEKAVHPSVEAQISQKEAFLNVCCFVFFRSDREEDFETFLDICAQESYFSTIQMVCPYMLRYICVAMLLNKSYQRYGKLNIHSLTGALERKLFNYSDPLTDFIKGVLVRFDFAASESLIHKVDSLKNDYFLGHLIGKIKVSAQILYYETYCKVYDTLTIESVATFLGKSADEAQQWIIQLFRRSGIVARIDSIQGVINISRTAWLKSTQSNATQELIRRTNTVVNNLARILVQ